MLGFKLIHVSEKGDSPQFSLHKTTRCNLIYQLQESQGCVIRECCILRFMVDFACFVPQWINDSISFGGLNYDCGISTAKALEIV